MKNPPSPDCGSCNLCCKLLAVPDIGKPAHMLCWHTTIHGGCALQKEKPIDPLNSNSNLAACAQFGCVWLASQKRELHQRGNREMRPDMCHVVLGPFDKEDPTLLFVQVDPEHGAAWRAPNVMAYLNEQRNKGCKFEIIIGDVRFDPFAAAL